MRSLELAGLSGFAIIAVFAILVVACSTAAGLPAIRSGELPLFGLQARPTFQPGRFWPGPCG